ncbi:MAG: hypothetical protein JOY99_08815 [Sphingomonadaceae bacterium]|nr:hypothetical protein [Sphingomonadaceae bacterium]
MATANELITKANQYARLAEAMGRDPNVPTLRAKARECLTAAAIVERR